VVGGTSAVESSVCVGALGAVAVLAGLGSAGEGGCEAAMKRFWREVGVGAAEGGWRVVLDGRPVATPAKRPLMLPSEALARAIACEWQAVVGEVRPEVMRLTRLANAATDQMPERRPAALEVLLGYAGTDLLCYRAGEPEDLVRCQQAAWQPLLDWLEARRGVRLRVVQGVLPEPQPDEAVQEIARQLEALPDWPLVALHALATALGSLVLAFALMDGRIDAEAAVAAALHDELYTALRWGTLPEQERRHGELRLQVEAATRFLSLLA
jgi:chaperone required for assembly of F1-ATPase